MKQRDWCLPLRLALFAAFVGLPATCSSLPSELEPVREPAVAGSWYPGDRDALAKHIDAMLARAKPSVLGGEVIALVSPHAGYSFSGPTAAAAYRHVQGTKYDAVVVLGPSHREYFTGASVYARGSYRTPLGAVPVDAELAAAIVSGGGEDVRAGLSGHRTKVGEHSLEIQLPFLQRVLPGLRIVPIVVGDYSLASARRVAGAIVDAARGKRVLIVASTDLYHGEDYEACVKVSAETLGYVEALDEEGLDRGLKEGRCQACGRGPMLIAMMAAKQMGADGARTLAQTNSGDVTGRREGYVVGYGAVAIYSSESGEEDVGGRLPPAARQELLEIARASVTASANGEPPTPLEVKHATLKEVAAAFVTLKRQGRLRGCIGCLPPGRHPVGLAVQQMARQAAIQDRRFRPVRPEEVEDIDIEISVLTPLEPVEDVEEIEIGRHGLWIRKGHSSGVFLPQVPLEQGWDRDTYLKRICLKAGLPPDAWRDPEARLWTFEAEVFGEQ